MGFPPNDARFAVPEDIRDLLWDPEKGNPRNMPAPIAELLVAIRMHALSHYLGDQEFGAMVRTHLARAMVVAAEAQVEAVSEER